MAKMSAVAILFSVLLDRLPGGEPHPYPLLGGTVLLWLLEGCEADTHREPTAGLNNTFSSSSKNLDKDFASIFDEILLQVLSKDPHYASLVEGGTAVTGSHLNKNDLQRNSLKTPEFSSSTNKRDDHLAKLFDMRSKNLPCGSLLHFLQRNIVVATLAAAAILAVTVLLLLMLATYMRRKQPLYPPANMTYNIFIMNGKTWWQKSQDTNLRKIAEKQKPLKCDSCV